MRFVRVLLLVLLTALLPVRGVMAAAMLCPPHLGTPGVAHALPADGDAAEADTAQVAHHHGDVHQADQATSAGHHHGGAATSASDTCHLCAACCSVPPVPSAGPALLLPQDPAATVFPSFAAPAPTFQSDGPERPPRSI